jgi:tetratricopeptide (TPR) repeat protein
LKNIFHRSIYKGLYNDALIVANMALEISPKFVVVHFTIANIYASMGDYDMAGTFYMSTVALQSSFDPARDRLMSLVCDKKLKIPQKAKKDEL